MVANCRLESPDAAWLALDDAWDFQLPFEIQCLDRIEATDTGRSLRFVTSRRAIKAFHEQFGSRFRRFMLSGSGDFHHLTAVFVRRLREPFLIISFDNHPDWDSRPPHWCCGTWMNRALESPLLKRVAIWGCANFELNPPHRWFANHAALRAGRLEVWPWIDRFGPSARRRWTGITSENWQDRFAKFAAGLSDS